MIGLGSKLQQWLDDRAQLRHQGEEGGAGVEGWGGVELDVGVLKCVWEGAGEWARDSWRPPTLHLLSHLPVTSPPQTEQNKTKTRKLNMKMYAKWAQPSDAGLRHDERVKGRRKSSQIFFPHFQISGQCDGRFNSSSSCAVGSQQSAVYSATWLGFGNIFVKYEQLKQRNNR